MLAASKMDSVLPSLAMLRKDNDDPRLPTPKIDNAEPNRTIERRDREEPK